MHTTIDRAGRVVIPKAIRARAGLLEGGAVEIIERDGAIEIVPAPASVSIVDTPAGPVVRTDDDVPPLDSATVRAVTDSVRP